MQTYQVGLLGIALLVVLIFIAYSGWRRRLKSQNTSLAIPENTLGDLTGASSVKGFYVSTTYFSDSLHRIIAHGLAHRGFTRIYVSPKGVLLERTGETSIAISKDSLIGISSASATIDKAVEKDGLITLDWRLGEELVSTFIRFASQSERENFLNAARESLQMELITK